MRKLKSKNRKPLSIYETLKYEKESGKKIKKNSLKERVKKGKMKGGREV